MACGDGVAFLDSPDDADDVELAVESWLFWWELSSVLPMKTGK